MEQLTCDYVMKAKSFWPETGYYAIVGFVATFLLFIALLLEIYKHLRLYLWTRIRPNKDYVAMYGKWAVITGGSDGIGKGFSFELAKRGMNICVLSNCENNIVHEIESRFQVEVKWIDVDFSTTDVYEQIESEISQLDVGILVNNVGIVSSKLQPFSKQSRQFMEKMINVNVTTSVMMTEIVLPFMLRKDKGLIVFIGSLASQNPTPYAALYASSKAFIENFCLCLATELSETNISIRCIEPFFVRTQLLKDMTIVTDFLKSYFYWAFPDGLGFAKSATSTFGVGSPVIYSGYSAHELIAFLLRRPFGKEIHTRTVKKIITLLNNEV